MIFAFRYPASAGWADNTFPMRLIPARARAPRLRISGPDRWITLAYANGEGPAPCQRIGYRTENVLTCGAEIGALPPRRICCYQSPFCGLPLKAELEASSVPSSHNQSLT